MNMDFHYYATYLAARVAGYEKEEAKTIAYAAQYVDESEADMIDNSLLPGLSETTPTIQNMYTLIKVNMDLIYEEMEIRKSEPIWQSFHFLPGNIHQEDDRKTYTGERSYSRVSVGGRKFGITEYGKEEARAFSMMCQPNSVLSEKMVNDIRKYKNKPNYLELVGIRMHVLADTWAHRYFAGTPSWWVNEAPKDVYYVPGGKKMKYSILKDFHITDIRKYMADNYFLTTPPMPSFRSFSYLGHGRMGAVPDVPFMHYRYKPKWSNQYIEKDNPEEFLLAFRQLVYAMNCIRGQLYFRRNVYAHIDAGLEADLRAVWSNEAYKASEAAGLWKPLIDKFCPESSAYLSDFNKDEWKREAEGAAEKEKTHYYYFNYSAVQHKRFVMSHLEKLCVSPALADKKRSCIEKTDVVMLKRVVGDDMWEQASTEICYLGHDGCKWTAQYKDGRFHIYYKGDRGRSHTSDSIDYLGEDDRKYRAKICVSRDGGEITAWKLMIQDVSRPDEWQEAAEMRYMAWDQKIYEMIPATWKNVDYTYLNGDFLKNNKKLFVCDREGRITISPRIPYQAVKTVADTDETERTVVVNGIFESFCLEDEAGTDVFNVNTEENREQNLISPELPFSSDGMNNSLLRIKRGDFLINGDEVCDIVTIRDWDGNMVKLYMIQWTDV